MRELQMLKTQAEIERAEIESTISELIAKQKRLIEFNTEVKETQERLNKSFNILLQEIASEIDKINDHVKVF